MEFIASQGIPFSSCLGHFRWGTAEWGYEGAGAKPLKTVNERINAEDRYDDEDPNGFETFKGSLFATMVLGLGDLDAEGFFGAGSARQSDLALLHFGLALRGVVGGGVGTPAQPAFGLRGIFRAVDEGQGDREGFPKAPPAPR
jgi:hypothetical protein